MPRRSATGTRKPVVPVIPLAYLQPQRRNQPAAPSVQSSLNDRPVRNEPANNHGQTEAQPNRADPKLDEPGRTTEDYDNSKTTTVIPQNEAQPSQPEAVTPSATTVNTVTAVNDGLATPPSAPSSKKGTGKLAISRCTTKRGRVHANFSLLQIPPLLTTPLPTSSNQ